jgi:polyferredoxin
VPVCALPERDVRPRHLIITYDAERGEPRGARKRGADPKPRASATARTARACVQVCPTGIDIRKGLQYECIACAACVDACDEVMDRDGHAARPGALHDAELARAQAGPRAAAAHHHLRNAARPADVGFIVSLALRKPVALDVIRDRNALYRMTRRR